MIRRFLDMLFVALVCVLLVVWWRSRTSSPPTVALGGALASASGSDSLPALLATLGRRSGPEDPAALITTFFDFSCGWCKESDSTLRVLAARFPEHLTVQRVDFLLDTTSFVLAAHEAAHCASDVASYQEFVTAAFDQQQVLSDRNGWTSVLKALPEDKRAGVRQCVAQGTHRERALASTRLALSLGLDVTPSFLIDGTMYQGTIEAPVLDSLIVGMIRASTKRTPTSGSLKAPLK